MITLDEAFRSLYSTIYKNRYERATVQRLYTYYNKKYGFTNKQRELIKQILFRYRKQFKEHGIIIQTIINNDIWTSELHPDLPEILTNIIDFNHELNCFSCSFKYNTGLLSYINDLRFQEFHISCARFDSNTASWNIPYNQIGVEVLRNIIKYLKSKKIETQLSNSCKSQLNRGFKLENGLLGFKNNNFIIKKFISSRQNDYANMVIHDQDLSFYQKLSKLVYAGFKLDKFFIKYLKTIHSDDEIEILANRVVTIKYSRADKVRDFLRYVNTHCIVEAIDVSGPLVKTNLEKYWESTDYNTWMAFTRIEKINIFKNMDNLPYKTVIAVLSVPYMDRDIILPVLFEMVGNYNGKKYYDVKNTANKYNFEKIIKLVN